MNADILFAIEVIGTIAFALSGALVAVGKRLDLVGIIVLGEITAIGGGIIRDVILGIAPPNAFQKPIYAEIAFATCIILFLAVRLRKDLLDKRIRQKMDGIMNLCDAVGLGAFTVVGMNTAITTGHLNDVFLTISMGVITGVGGGILRDVLSSRIPVVLCKHVYVCASLAGALVYMILVRLMPSGPGMVIAMAVVVIIRMLASKYRWNLPRAI